MIPTIKSRLFCLVHDERGQVLPVMAVMLVALLGITGLVVDMGHVGYCRSQMQASTDAAALAGAQALPQSSATSVATNYSAVSGGSNVKKSLPNVTMVTGYPKTLCLNTLKAMGQACSSPTNANAIQVKQQVVIPMYFASVLGFKSYTITTTATAAMRGSTPTPYNVAIILDTTLSMNSTDDNCGAGITQMQCALNGVQTLLATMNPCATNFSTCTITNGVSANSVDRVALFGFPNVTTATASIDSNCTTQIPTNYQNNDPTFGPYTMFNSQNGNFNTETPYGGVPTAGAYSNPTVGATSYSGTTLTQTGPYNTSQSVTVTYQLTPFLSDYKTSDKATTLNPNSALVKAIGAVSGCGSMLPPNFDGEEGTYYAGAIYAAQSALTAEAAAFPGSKNVIILLSDGDANVTGTWNGYSTMPAGNATGTYPSYVGDCGQGVKASLYAQAAGTRVYTVAYGSPVAGCLTDVLAGSYPNITPCTAMLDMATGPQDFFSDYSQSGTASTCISSAQPSTNMNQIFAMIANDLTVARLIPDNTT